MLPDGHVLVTGGMGLGVVPPSLFSLNTMSFFDPATQTSSSSYTPSGGGGPVSPVLATPRSSHTQTTLLDGRALITGGRTGANGTNPGSAVSSVEIFDPATKVCLCHFPPGNPEKAKTICVDSRAVDAHLTQHGDVLGDCDD